LGTVVAWPPMMRTGWPIDVTRVAPMTHWAVTQGPGGTGAAQAATT
jgi:hypothetical protein